MSKTWMEYIFGGFVVKKVLNENEIEIMDRKTKQKCLEIINPFLKYSLETLYSTKESAKLAKSKIAKETIQFGKDYDDPKSAKKIPGFVKFFKIDMNQFTPSNISAYPNFNSFFYRKFKPGARKIENASVIICPTDSRVIVFKTIQEATRLWIKGTSFSMEKLLGKDLANEYQNASIAIFRLAPQDYHRFHSPVSGKVTFIGPILGQEYYSVNPIAINSKTDVFGDNKRRIIKIKTKKYNQILYIPVGASLVGSINFTVKKGMSLSRMSEIGYFAFGGSTVICIFKKDTITFDSDLIENSENGIETLVKLGESLGK
jgi:phosphatidylserine decarboxylase